MRKIDIAKSGPASVRGPRNVPPPRWARGPRRRLRLLATMLVLLLPAVARGVAPTPDEGPLAPGEARGSFRLEPGLRLELVAAEPLVVSPVAMAFDERGRLFVAENRGYPTGPGEGKPPAGRIVRLEDT